MSRPAAVLATILATAAAQGCVIADHPDEPTTVTGSWHLTYQGADIGCREVPISDWYPNDFATDVVITAIDDDGFVIKQSGRLACDHDDFYMDFTASEQRRIAAFCVDLGQWDDYWGYLTEPYGRTCFDGPTIADNPDLGDFAIELFQSAGSFYAPVLACPETWPADCML